MNGIDPDHDRSSPISILARIAWVGAGSVSVGVGILGIFLPLLPTTPFLLFAAACYVRSSPRLYRRLMTNRITGAYIRNYREGNGMPMRAKVLSIILLWGTLLASAFLVEYAWVRIILLLVAIGVPILILRIPTLKEPVE